MKWLECLRDRFNDVIGDLFQAGAAYVAMYDYDAQDTDEVSFIEGDRIINTEAIDDGWMSGEVERTGDVGLLPANYVELVAGNWRWWWCGWVSYQLPLPAASDACIWTVLLSSLSINNVCVMLSSATCVCTVLVVKSPVTTDPLSAYSCTLSLGLDLLQLLMMLMMMMVLMMWYDAVQCQWYVDDSLCVSGCQRSLPPE